MFVLQHRLPASIGMRCERARSRPECGDDRQRCGAHVDSCSAWCYMTHVNLPLLESSRLRRFQGYAPHAEHAHEALHGTVAPSKPDRGYIMRVSACPPSHIKHTK